MPTEVIATPRADQQIAGLDRTHAKAFGEFLDDLAARGCKALGYRLSGPAPVDHMCVKQLRGSYEWSSRSRDSSGPGYSWPAATMTRTRS